MFWIILILTWICSCIIYIVWTYYENKHTIFKIGDLIDLIEIHMWFPVINTGTLIFISIAFILYTIAYLLKLPELWEKFRNIKLK